MRWDPEPPVELRAPVRLGPLWRRKLSVYDPLSNRSHKSQDELYLLHQPGATVLRSGVSTTVAERFESTAQNPV